ncbi:alpha/beta-hydrolase [Thozetella sp. PMI_491]|nr:alpha/beta-hydrolase [Thozetella sp. PMI_491]
MVEPIRTSKFVDIHGHQTFVDVDGIGGDAPVMICCHGLGGSTNYFQPLIPKYSSRFKIIRFDFKGLGRTGHDPESKRRITIPAYVEDLQAVLESEGVTKAVVIGHSLGSVVAMHFSAAFPEKVSALVLIGPGKSRAQVPAAKAFTLGMAKNARELGMPAMADATVAKNVALSSSDAVRAFVREVIAGQSGEGYAQVCEAACDDSHVDPDYSKIVSPTIIVAGDQDLISSLEQAKEIQSDIKGSFLEVVHAGHQQVLEDTAGVVAAVEKVLEHAGDFTI